MNVILSRKGFDSSYGGIPSPIIYSEKEKCHKFYSLPIPTENSDISFNDIILFEDKTAGEFLSNVKRKEMKFMNCHLDPDIRKSAYNNRPDGWKKCFGQVKQAQSHLEKYKIGKGDVFLFFGWFKYAEWNNGKFRFIKDKNYPNGFHAIYSYLQIGEIIKLNNQNIPDWLSYHPHVKFKEKEEFQFKNNNNTIYVASDNFEYETIIKSGSATFVFDKDLILTKKGEKRRTVWELPSTIDINRGIELSYNPSKKWKSDNGKIILNSASRGQEFIFTDNKVKDVEKWCVDLIRRHDITD